MKLIQLSGIKVVFFIFGLLMFTSNISVAQTPVGKISNVCDYWESKANRKIKLPEEYPRLDETDEKNILQAIDCLLKLEGNINDSGYGTGGTSIENSNAYPSPSVELAALYYVTVLYLDDFPYYAIKLVNKKGEFLGKEAVKPAYKSYRKWYKKVKEIGLTKAREMKLDPLAGSNIWWYGPRN